MSTDKVPASSTMRHYFQFSEMESPERARVWLRELVTRYPYAAGACALFENIEIEVGDLSREWGGGFWYPDTRTVQLRGCQDEAAIHELAHAFWEDVRRQGTIAAELMQAVQRLAHETDPRYRRAATLAHHYIYGIPTQPDPNSPTGWWRGMLVENNDWEMFAGLASGIMADLRLLPPYVHRFYRGLFREPEE